MENTTALFDVYPIVRRRAFSTTYEYRFGCLLPKSSFDVRLSMLHPEEALLIYSHDAEETIGQQFKDGSVEEFYEQGSTDAPNVGHYGFGIKKLPDHIMSDVFGYMQREDRLEELFALVNIIAKGGLEVVLNRIKKEMHKSYELNIEKVETPILFNHRIYEVDEELLAGKKIMQALNNNEIAFRAFHHLQDLFFHTIEQERTFVNTCLECGLNMELHVALPIDYASN